MSNKPKYPILPLQAQYRKKILAAGFRLDVVSEEEHEDGVGACTGNNYVKNGCFYDFEWALDVIGELDNYRNDRSAALEAYSKARREWMGEQRKHFDSNYVSPDYDM